MAMKVVNVEKPDFVFMSPVRSVFLYCSEHVRKMKNIVRVLFRFTAIMVITGFYSLRYFLLTKLFGYNHHRFTRHTKYWADKLIKYLNIKILTEGEIPDIYCLIVANHRSYIDIPVLYSILSGVFLAKREVMDWPILGFAARAAGTIFVERDNTESRSAAREEIKKRLLQGERIYVFPEGTTSEGPRLLEFKNGVFVLASESDIYVLPVAIQYSDKNDAWLGNDTFIGHFFRTFCKKELYVKIVFNNPVKDKDPERLRKFVHRRIYESLPNYYEVICDLETPT